MKNLDNRDRAKFSMDDSKENSLAEVLGPELTNLGISVVKMYAEGKNRVEEDITVEEP